MAHAHQSVANNASWAVGEVAIKVDGHFMRPYVQGLARAHVSMLER